MSKHGMLVALLALHALACREPAIILLSELEDARVAIALVLRDGAPVVAQSKVIVPGDDSAAATGVALEEGDELVLALLDEDALERGSLSTPNIEAGPISLHPEDGHECGLRGNETSLLPDGNSRIRQPLRRFEPTFRKFDLAAGALAVAGDEEIASAQIVELEFVAHAEGCRDRWRVELRPFGSDVVFGGGVFENGERLADEYHETIRTIRFADDARVFLATTLALFAVRRGEAFDPAQDGFVRLDALGLPPATDERWLPGNIVVEPGVVPGTQRLFLLAARAPVLGDPTGWSLIEFVFDGISFLDPIVWIVSEDAGPTLLRRDVRGRLVMAGFDGAWAIANTIENTIETGRVGIEDIQTLAMTTNPGAPHAIGIRGGSVSVGDLGDASSLSLLHMNSGASSAQLETVLHDGAPWLYVGWKDGTIERGRLGAGLALESSGQGLPRRLALCAGSEFDACGRAAPFGVVSGLGVLAKPGLPELMLSVFEGCSTLVLHEINSGCTTGVDLPTESSFVKRQLRILQDGARFWVSELFNDADAYELTIEATP